MIDKEKATVHGFRASFKTWATEHEAGYDWNLVEMCLAHEVGNEVAQAYLRGKAIERRRTIMQAWADYCGC